MNAREKQIKQVTLEMECEELGHVFEFGKLPCIRCGESYGELGLRDSGISFDELAKSLTKMGHASYRASDQMGRLMNGISTPNQVDIYSSHHHLGRALDFSIDFKLSGEQYKSILTGLTD